MKIKARIDANTTREVACFGLFEVNFDGVDIMFAFTDAIDSDSLKVTDYKSGLSFPIDLGEKSGTTQGLRSPMMRNDPVLARLIYKANTAISDVLELRGIKRSRMLELIEMNQRKYKTNEIDF